MTHVDSSPFSAIRWLDDLSVEAGGDATRDHHAREATACWADVTAACERLAATFGDREAALAAWTNFSEARFERLSQTLPGSFNDQRQLYWALQRWLLRDIVRDLACDHEELDDGRIRLTLHPPAGSAPCPLAYELIRAAFAVLPALVAQPRSAVEVEPVAGGAAFTITPSTISKREFPHHYDEMLRVEGKVAYEWDMKTGVVTIRSESDDVGFSVGGGGIDPEELLSDVPPADREHFADELRRAIATGDQFRVQYTHHPRGQQPVMVENSGFFVTDDDGVAVRMVGYAQNVTDARREEEAAREYRDMLDRIAGASPEILYLFDLTKWQMLYINDAVEQLLGFSSAAILEDPGAFAQRIHPDDLKGFEHFAESVLQLADDGVVEFTFRIRHADESWRWIRLRNRQVSRTPDGCLREVLGVAADVTEFKRAQEERAISHERYRIVSELTSDYSFSVRINRDWTMEREWITEAFESITGYRPEEVGEGGWERLVHPEDHEIRRKQFEEAILSGRAIHEYRIVQKSGGVRVIREHSRILHNNDGTLHWYGACRDITEQKLAENAGALIQERFNAITKSSGDIITEFDEIGRVLYVSPNISDTLGHDAVSLMTRRRPDLIHPDDMPVLLKRLRRISIEGGSANAIFRLKTADGEWRWMDTTATMYRTALGRSRSVMVSRDITDRLEIEGERQRLVAIVENSSELIAMTETDGRILFMNEAGQRLVGFADDFQARDATIFDCLSPEHAQGLRFQILPIVEQDGHWEGELQLSNRETGACITTLTHVFLVAGRRRDRERVVAFVIRDISERITAERMLRESEARHRTLVESSYDLIAEIDLEGRYVYASPNFDDQLGQAPTSLIGRSWYEQIHEDDREAAAAAIRKLFDDAPINCPPLRIRHANGSWRWVETNLRRYENTHGTRVALAFFHDITRRREAEEALRRSQADLLQSQKMEAIGRLAGGVAHDFNNLLTAITGYCDLLLEEIDEGSQMRSDAEEIISAAERAATLTHQLLAFSRRQILVPTVIDLNEMVADVERLLRRLIGEDIELTTRFDSDAPHVRLDAGQLEQLVINLAVNARDAMPNGGRLEISTVNLEIGTRGDPAHPGIAPGRYVMLRVEDGGIGMDPSTLSKIFEPFFSTKERGKGTGLGLATAYGIIQQSGGEIRVESEVGQGSVFSVYLPQVEASVPVEESAVVEETLTGDETILLVEDSDTVRRLVQRYLEKHGYTVLYAQSGLDALTVAETYPDPIDLIVTDVVLPRMDGHEAAQRVRKLRPGIRVLYMSGFSDDALSRHGISERDIDLIQKPFSQRDLLLEVRRILAGSGEPDSTSAETRATLPLRNEMH